MRRLGVLAALALALLWGGTLASADSVPTTPPADLHSCSLPGSAAWHFVNVPITAEGEAEKPTRKPPARKGTQKRAEPAESAEPVEAAEPTEEVAEEPVAEAEDAAEESTPKKRTRRGSLGGRRRRKKPATATAEANGEAPKIHVPDRELGDAQADEEPAPPAESTDGVEAAPKAKTKARRGTRGGRNRKRKTAATAVPDGEESSAGATEPEPANEEDWGYVPMSEWADDVLSE